MSHLAQNYLQDAASSVTICYQKLLFIFSSALEGRNTPLYSLSS